MLSIAVNHPDIEEFISVKGDLNKICKANISIRKTDEFMQKAELGEQFKLSFVRKETGEAIEKEVNAKVLLNKFATMNWRTAEPGGLFWDRIKNWNLLSEDSKFEFAGVNPCAEEPLPAGGSCLLGSINLSEFVVNPFTPNASFDFDGLKDAVDIAVREMNIVLDEGLPLHPLAIQRESVAKWRQIGLGIMGLADVFIKVGIEYGGFLSVSLSDSIAKAMIQQAMKTSALLAKEHGAYPACNISAILRSAFFKANATPEIRELVGKYGLRNSQLLTIAPTGSISTMLGVSGGIEPIFARKFLRTTKSLHGKDESYEVFPQIVQDCMKAYSTDEPPDHIVTAMEISPERRIAVQATWQKYIDAAISSTINLPQETTVKEVADIYMQAWKAGLKGITVYRSGCEREGVLTVESDEEEERVENENNNCPDCGGDLTPEGGCFTCPSCGWGKCSV
jgi:ribonucleoside-diphosphate reductase alpha chain